MSGNAFLFGLVVVSAKTVTNYGMFLECILRTTEVVLLNNIVFFQVGRNIQSPSGRQRVCYGLLASMRNATEKFCLSDCIYTAY